MRLNNELQAVIINNDLLLKELLLLLFNSILKGLRCKLVLTKLSDLYGINFSSDDLHPQIVVIIIPQSCLKLSVFATVVLGLYKLKCLLKNYDCFIIESPHATLNLRADL